MTANIVNDGYELVSLVELGVHPRNPRKGNIEAIETSINSNGFYGAIVVQRSTKKILAGNHRMKAAAEAGLEKIPVIWADVDDATATRILLADNRTNDLATYDNEVLAELLVQLRDEGELIGSGYDDSDVDKVLDKIREDDEDTGGDADVDELPDGWGVIVTCTSEQQQTTLLTQLNEEGFECRALIR